MPLVSELLELFEASDGAKTRCLNYCFDVRDTLQRRDLQDRFKAGQKERIEALLQATLELLNSPSSVFGTEQDFCTMQKELEEVLTPIPVCWRSTLQPMQVRWQRPRRLRRRATTQAQAVRCLRRRAATRRLPSPEARTEGGRVGLPSCNTT